MSDKNDEIISGAAEAGDDIEEWADKMMGYVSDSKANFIMGVSSLSFVFVLWVLYFSMNRFYGIKSMRIMFWVSQVAYLPQGMIWVSSAFWDIVMLRKVTRISTALSLLAPFAGNWIAVIFFMIYIDENSMWTEWFTWVGITLWLGWTFFAMIIQVVLSPKIFSWANTAPGDL